MSDPFLADLTEAMSKAIENPGEPCATTSYPVSIPICSRCWANDREAVEVCAEHGDLPEGLLTVWSCPRCGQDCGWQLDQGTLDLGLVRDTDLRAHDFEILGGP